MLTALKSARLNGVPFRVGRKQRRSERQRERERTDRQGEEKNKFKKWSFGKLVNKSSCFKAMTFHWSNWALQNQRHGLIQRVACAEGRVWILLWSSVSSGLTSSKAASCAISDGHCSCNTHKLCFRYAGSVTALNGGGGGGWVIIQLSNVWSNQTGSRSQDLNVHVNSRCQCFVSWAEILGLHVSPVTAKWCTHG